jgi:hypothetical protein
MRRLLALGVLTVLAAPLAAPAAEVPARPLRSLEYAVTYSAHSSHEKKTSGFNGAYGGGGGTAATSTGGATVSGTGTAGVGLDGTDAGRLTIDVIAATKDDGGLVVDTAYSGKLNAQPRMRVALFPDGRLSAAPSQVLGPEALHILPLLARGFVANRDVSPGASWTVPAPAPARGSTTYRVSRIEGDQATIVYEGSISVPGINGFDESDRGTTTYQTDLLSPVSYDLNARIHRQVAIDESITTDTHLTATLVHDTFAKK